MKPTGIRPSFSPRLDQSGFKLGGDVYGVGIFGQMMTQPGRRK